MSGGLGEQLRLIGVLIVARHGHRAPLYSLPNHHPPPLNCHLRHVRSSHVDRAQAARFAAAMDALLPDRNSTDSSWRRHGLYPASTSCSGAQLTAAGALQMLRLGLALRARGYSELATSGIAVRASDYSRTVQSAAALLYGLAGQASSLVESASVELTHDAYLCLEQRRAPPSSSSSLNWNLTCGCRAALTTLSLRRRHDRTVDVDERRLRDETANILNTTSSRLPWTAAILEVPSNDVLHILGTIGSTSRHVCVCCRP